MTPKLTTTLTRSHYADAISDAIADAEAILGAPIVTRVECVAVIQSTLADPHHVTGYEATVESTRIAR